MGARTPLLAFFTDVPDLGSGAVGWRACSRTSRARSEAGSASGASTSTVIPTLAAAAARRGPCRRCVLIKDKRVVEPPGGPRQRAEDRAAARPSTWTRPWRLASGIGLRTEPADDGEAELGRPRAVDHAVVEA